MSGLNQLCHTFGTVVVCNTIKPILVFINEQHPEHFYVGGCFVMSVVYV